MVLSSSRHLKEEVRRGEKKLKMLARVLYKTLPDIRKMHICRLCMLPVKKKKCPCEGMPVQLSSILGTPVGLNARSVYFG